MNRCHPCRQRGTGLRRDSPCDLPSFAGELVVDVLYGTMFVKQETTASLYHEHPSAWARGRNDFQRHGQDDSCTTKADLRERGTRCERGERP
jgi:hypothetical protein